MKLTNDQNETRGRSAPSDWETVALGDICECRGGCAFPHEYQGQLKGDYPFYKVSDMNLPGNEKVMTKANNYVSARDLSLLRTSPFKSGSVIFPKIGGAVHTNKKRILKKDSIVDNNIMVIWVEKSQQCVDDFLFFIFETINLTDLANIGTLPSITNSRVKDHKILLPPLSEQRRITVVLNIIQDSIAAQEDVIAAACEFKRSLMQRLFTYGPGKEPAETKDTEIGEVPKHWRLVTLGDVIALQRGFDITKKEQTHGNIPVVSSGGIRSYHNSAQAKGPGVIIGRKGTLGTVHYVDCDYWPHDTTLWVKDFKGNNPRFIAYFLELLRLEQFDSGAANPTLNRNTIYTELVAYPEVSEQEIIANMLMSIDQKIAAEEDRKTALQAFFKSMLHQLMTGQIRLLSDEGLPL